MHIAEDPELDAAYDQFARGVPLPLVQLHFDRGELDEAATIARLALARPDCPDADAIEEILDACSAPPEDWKELLDAFVAAPSLERWKELMRFVPDDVFYQRQRNSIRHLVKSGVDPNLVFQCACTAGLTPDAIELVEKGLVGVDTIVARANDAGPARGAYIGLAAQAAYVAGDLVGTIRLLREAMANENEWISVLPHVWFIRGRATKTEHAALDKAGIPRGPG
ncbi:MAG TPA: hypothetical protein VM733_01380 [Thermoanaerobaculia bacterium]|nr:hypothetical protein [Thermoanaerobaculia bacterium]